MILDHLLKICDAETLFEPEEVTSTEWDLLDLDPAAISDYPVEPVALIKCCRALSQVGFSFALNDCLHHFRRWFLHFLSLGLDDLKTAMLALHGPVKEREFSDNVGGEACARTDLINGWKKDAWCERRYSVVRKAYDMIAEFNVRTEPLFLSFVLPS